MARTRPAYPPEFRQQMVELVRSGRTPEELSLECRADRPDTRQMGARRR